MAETDRLTGGNIEPRGLEEEMKSAYLDYAMSVIVGRALPDARDGLKPVHRRVLFAMNEAGLQPNRPYAKCARIVGDVMGKYHPHGDSAIYDTLVRLAQDFSLRYMLVDGQGNFGSIDDDPAAAMRYCVTGGTHVSTPEGLIRIDQLAPGLRPDSQADVDLTVLDRRGAPVRASKVFHSGDHPTLEVRTIEGCGLTGSHNHPILCLVNVEGVPLLLWKLLEEIKPGDRPVLARKALPQLDRMGHQVPYVADYVRSESGFTGPGVAIMERIACEETRRVVEPLVSGEYYYAEVASVVDAGVQPVYSIRVDTDDHSFLTDGFVSHNTEARLSRIATEMLRDLDEDTVDFVPNYDGKENEPLVLPSRFPNLLVNGGSGIAVGMATNIPPHNLGEVIGATKAFIDDPDISIDGLMRHIKGPDFPTGGVILGTQGIRDAYETGRGRVRVQARVHFEPLSQGKEAIIVTELPFMVKKGGEGGLITKIAQLVQEKKISEISDLRDESDKRGTRLVIELKRGEMTKVVLNKLFKHTPMQTTFGVNTVALVDGVPRTLSLREAIHAYVGHQREVVTRRTQYRLRRAEARAHILLGLLIALKNLDAVIELIRASRDPDVARTGLMEKFDLSHEQAQAILDLRLQRLTALESDKIQEEHDDLVELIRELREILGDESKVMNIIKEELSEIEEQFGDERRTEITAQEGDLDIEDLIADQQMVVTITQSGYVKSLPLATYRKQHRGGVGVTGMDMKDGDYIEHLFVCSSHDYLLFFTNRGVVYRIKVYDLPEAARTAKGRALVNLLALGEEERVQSVIETRDFTEGQHLVFATKKGQIKKTEFVKYNTHLKEKGLIAIKIAADDELVAVRRTSGDDDIIMVSRSGQASRFHEDQARPMGRDTGGVRGMNVSQKGNAVIAMDVARDDQELFVVTENGFGKRTTIADYPRKNRGTMGVKTIALTEKKGALAGALVVREHQELVFISQNGMVQRTSVKGISLYGRSSQGVKVMNVREDDLVSAVALIAESSAETGAAVAEDLSELEAGAGDAVLLKADSDGAAADEASAPEAAEDDAAPEGDEE